MRILFAVPALLILGGPVLAADETAASTAILVSPIHDAQVVRGDDGMDHVEYELLVTNTFDGPVTLTSVAVLGPDGATLATIEGDLLAAATQTILSQAKVKSIPESGAASVDVDLILKPGTVPERLTHRIAYTLAPDAKLKSIIGSLEVTGPEVAVGNRPALVIQPPLAGPGWWNANGCCSPNVHRDTRIAIDGMRIETPETFAIDWVQVKDNTIFNGDGKANEQHHAFGTSLLAVADGTVVATRNDMPEELPFAPVKNVNVPSDYGGNHVILEIGPGAYAVYGHMQTGSVIVKVGDTVKAGDVLGKLGNSGNTTAPHLHFAVLDKPDFFAGRSLPFVFPSYTIGGAVVADESAIKVTGTPRPVENVYPLYLTVQDYP